jgi:hypothetical protein
MMMYQTNFESSLEEAAMARTGLNPVCLMADPSHPVEFYKNK